MPDLKIALVTTYPPGSGSLNEYAYHFVRFLRQKAGIAQITLLVDELPAGQSYPIEVEDTSGLVPMQIVPCWNFEGWRNPLRIFKAIRQAKPDVVLFNIQFASFGSKKIPASLGLLAPVLAKAAGYPTIVLLHNIMETIDLKNAGFKSNPFMEKLTRLFGTIFTRLLLTTDWVALTIPKYVETLEKKYHTSNVLLAPHGSFEDTPAPSFELDATRPLQIMTFGKFGTYKKVEQLIEAFKLLQSQSRPPLELVIAGTNSPNAPGYIEGLQQEYTSEQTIRFTGYVPEDAVSRIFGEAAVVVFPYTSTTGSSGVLHQAGEYGKAVVLPRIGDLAEVISEEGYTGEFFEPGDHRDLAEAIARVLDNPERRREIGTQNYMAARGLPIAEVVDWYLLHFQSLLNKRHQQATRRATLLSRLHFAKKGKV